MDDDMYLHPGFKLDSGKHELLLEQATTMRDIIDGKQVRSSRCLWLPARTFATAAWQCPSTSRLPGLSCSGLKQHLIQQLMRRSWRP